MKPQTTNYKLQTNSGFSLLELLIYLAVLSMILLATLDNFGVFFKSKIKIDVKSEVEQNLSFAVQKITQEIRKGTSVALEGTCNLNSLNIGGTKIFSVSPSGVLQFNDGSGPRDITSALVKVVDSGSCLFQIINNPGGAKSLVQINLKMEYNNQGRPDLANFEEIKTAVSLR